MRRCGVRAGDEPLGEPRLQSQVALFPEHREPRGQKHPHRHVGDEVVANAVQRRAAQPCPEVVGARRLRLRLGLDEFFPDGKEAFQLAWAAGVDPQARARRQRAELQRAIEAERLNTRSPEAGPWPADPWPALTADEQQTALSVMKNEAQQIARQATLPIAPIETDYVLFYSDMPRLQAAKLARMLDRTYDEISKLVGLRDGRNIFWGKAAVLVFKDQDRFRLVEAETFGQLVPLKVTGMCHPVGPKVFISCYATADDDELAATLVREMVHGYLHRFGSPKRLPAWANEGLAEYLVAASVKADSADNALRRAALQFIRGGGNVQAVLDLKYADDTWPGPNEIGRAVGFLLIELMIRENPAGFGAWVRAVKQGDDWPEALRDRYGVSRRRLVGAFVQYYLVND